MRKLNIKYVENIKKYLIISGALLLIGIIATCIFGVNLDINYTGGSRISYYYTGDMDMALAEKTVEDVLKSEVDLSQSTDMTGTKTKIEINVSGNNSISTEKQTALTEALTKAFPNSKCELGDLKTFNPSIGANFFAKSMVAVVLAAFFVILYIAIRFRNIGGISAGFMAFIALVHDIVIAFFVCVIFQLEIDVNFMAVVLTILGYSLNDTIVIYDRVRENRKLYPTETIRNIVNKSVNESLTRSVVTSLTTFAALVVVIVVAELNGLTTLRSFAIPMAVGVISGCYSTICLSGPLWVLWLERKAKKNVGKKK